jgi:hypothetical protein
MLCNNASKSRPHPTALLMSEICVVTLQAVIRIEQQAFTAHCVASVRYECPEVPILIRGQPALSFLVCSVAQGRPVFAY